MLSIDDVVAQINEYLYKHPDADYEEIGSGLGRPAGFIHGICKLRNIDIGAYKPRPSKKIVKRSIGKVQAKSDDYNQTLIGFYNWCKDRDFDFRLGVMLAIRLFTDTVNKSTIWQLPPDRILATADEDQQEDQEEAVVGNTES